MDSYLVEYLKSGKAWLLVGSGPSSEMGYPSWRDLAVAAISAVKANAPDQNHKRIDQALLTKDFPSVFEKARNVLGWPGLLQVLQRELKPKGQSEIYKLITRWPAAVYLTTNYDDEIQSHLAEHKETYIPYNNTEDHLGFLLPELQGAIVKIHGDLRSEQGLILTSSQYKDISESPQWAYWRNKMTSIFQMNRVIVVGHSLRDPNIRHVLEAAKKGGGVTQPICWIAPDVTRDERKEYLEKYRIRVLAYDNQDGNHINLLRLIQNISEFVPPRTSVSIREQIKIISYSPLGESGAAPGFFVFNKLAAQSDYEGKRTDIILAAIQAVIPTLCKLGNFSLEKAFDLAGWPSQMQIPLNFLQEVKDKAIQSDLLVETSMGFMIGKNAEAIAAQSKSQFDHLRNRYKQQLKLRLRNKFPSLSDAEASLIATDIEASLTGYFREGGLSLASTLFSSYHAKSNLVPSSIIDFINEASAKYDSLLMRQAFSTVSVDSFLKATPTERDFLGRISQGFFAFHSLGVFGEVAIERFKKAKESIWLVDSNIQIPALAFAAPTNPVFVDCFSRLRDAGIRLFSTYNIFQETFNHLYYAMSQIKDYGPESVEIMAAALGQAPYARGNQFLEGFIRWQAAGNQSDWGNYLFQCFKERQPKEDHIRAKLEELGVEVIDFDMWPGFSDLDYREAGEYAAAIVTLRGKPSASFSLDDEGVDNGEMTNLNVGKDPYKKSLPEAEAFIITKNEREGQYHMLSELGAQSDAWFISNTSILNLLERDGNPVTWPPDAFLKFSSTLSKPTEAASSDKAFQTILWSCAQSGLSLLDEDTVATVLGGAIDQAALSLEQERQRYTETIGAKYGEPIEAVLSRLSPVNRPLAAIQLANEMAQVSDEKRQRAEHQANQATEVARSALKKVTDVEKQLAEVEKFKRKIDAKKAQSKRNKRKQKANKPKSRRR